MAGDYLQHQFNHTRKIKDLFILAATDDQTDVIAVKSANHRIYIQKITVAITTYAAKTWTFQDDASTPVPIWHISIPAAAPTTAGDATHEIDFGPTGIALTLGKNLDLDVSAAGAAGAIHIEAYEKLEGVIAAFGGASNQ